jgi:linoleoyl-CoA desaturase
MTASAVTIDTRWDSFAREVDDLRERMHAKVGAEDVAHIKKVARWSKGLKIAGRALIHASIEPVTFFTGVLALGTGNILEAIEIGHTSLHGTFDDLPDAKEFHSTRFRWDGPMDEESFRHAHNVKHHGFVNLEGEDPDISTGFVRVATYQRHRFYHWLQVPSAALFVMPNLIWLLGFRYTGLSDVYMGYAPERSQALKDRSLSEIVLAHKRMLRKAVPYFFKNYVFYPALAGPFFPKVVVGNWLAFSIRDSWLSASIFCTHQGEEMTIHPRGTPRPQSKGEFYARQVEGTRNTGVKGLMSILNGALELHIEHHLFPKLPTNRLREIGPELREICEKHGVNYRVQTWADAGRSILRHWMRTSVPWNKEPRPAPG